MLAVLTMTPRSSPSGSCFAICGGGEADHVEGSDQVDADDELEAFEVGRLPIAGEHTARETHTGAVDDDVKATELVRGRVDGGLHLVFDRHVGGREAGPVTELLRDDLAVRRREVDDHDRGTGVVKLLDGRSTESRRSSGDERDLAFDVHTASSISGFGNDLAGRAGRGHPRISSRPARRRTARGTARRRHRRARAAPHASRARRCGPSRVQDRVGRQDRRQPVRDRDRRSPPHERSESLLHQALGDACRARSSPRRGSGSEGPSGSRERSRDAASRRPTSCSHARPRSCRSPRASRRSDPRCGPLARQPRARRRSHRGSRSAGCPAPTR